VRIKWLGHACFLIETADGTRIVTDPFNEEVGYPLPAVEAEIVTVSHQHFDHNAVAVVRGRPHVSTFHDAEQGAKRGANVVFVIEADGLRICHLGDLGHLLNEEQLRRIGRVDVLLVPVGGTFTIDAGQAAETVAALRPRIAVPMHYKTDYINFPITGLEDFSRLFERVSTCDTLEVTAARLPAATEIVVVSFAGTGAAS
jgi:L-ascorbate metabolism protein UlaG (beta-lactamase superfamily)